MLFFCKYKAIFLIKDVNAEKFQELSKLSVRVRLKVAPSLELTEAIR